MCVMIHLKAPVFVLVGKENRAEVGSFDNDCCWVACVGLK